MLNFICYHFALVMNTTEREGKRWGACEEMPADWSRNSLQFETVKLKRL